MARYPPKGLPTARRVFAHVLLVDIACPFCGRLHAADTRKLRRFSRQPMPRHGRGTLRQGYDYIRGLFTCKQCQKQYHVGVILYPRPSGAPGVTLKDTRPNLLEARALREEGSWAAGDFPPDAHGNVVEASGVLGGMDGAPEGVRPVAGQQAGAGGTPEGGRVAKTAVERYLEGEGEGERPEGWEE